jgi:ParB family chromosome partitioning protein
MSPPKAAVQAPAKAAGRKLNLTNTALLGRATARAASLFGVDDGRSLREIDLAAITPNPHQPRRVFDPVALQALTDSIERHGLLQPICVREVTADRYQIIAGERRFRAVAALHWASVPAIVTHTDDPATLALIENVQREDLDAVELAAALQALLGEHGATHEQLGLLIGKSQAYVTRTLGVLSLPAAILDDYHAHRGQVSASALMIVAETDGEEAQRALWEQAKAGLSVRQLQAKRKGKDTTPSTADSDTAGTGTDDVVDKLAASLRKSAHALRACRQRGEGLSDDRRRALQTLRDEIDALLSQPGETTAH